MVPRLKILNSLVLCFICRGPSYWCAVGGATFLSPFCSVLRLDGQFDSAAAFLFSSTVSVEHSVSRALLWPAAVVGLQG